MNKYVFGQQRQQAQERQVELEEMRRDIGDEQLDPSALEGTLSVPELQSVVRQLAQHIRVLELERENRT